MVALLAVGCGSSNSSSSTSAGGPNYQGAATTSTAASSGAATVDVASDPKLGQVLVDANGNTLYLFKKDESTESYCKGGCAGVWPPYTTSGNPKAGSGVTASKLATLKRDDGSTQVVYAGHPLYTYTQDTKPGDVTGNGISSFGAEWYALHTNGQEAETGGKS